MQPFFPNQPLKEVAYFRRLKNRQEGFRRVIATFDIKGGELSHDRFEEVLEFRIDGWILVVSHIGCDCNLFWSPIVILLRAGHGPGPLVRKGLELIGIAWT